MTDSNKRPASRGSSSSKSPAGPAGPTRSTRAASTSPTGTGRAGRRETPRRRYEQQSVLQRFRTPLLALAVVAVIVAVGAFVFASASSPAYACSSVDTVKPAASGEIGQVQADMGNTHVNPGDKVTYAVCPPASGKHINRTGFGPLKPQVYGPEDNSLPNGWLHNLEHGGLVLLYSCDKGACGSTDLQQLQSFSAGFPPSAVCKVPPGVVAPVIARFERMPTRYAALVWDRVLYLDALDTQKIYDLFTRYAERLSSDGSFIAPIEPQCSAPSPSAPASPSAAASPSASAAPSASAGTSAAPSASGAAPSPGAETSPSPSAS